MRPVLSRRLARAFAVGFPSIEDRRRVIAAAEDPHVAKFGDLPPDIRDLVALLERGPRP